jgi:hypothetical protein
MGSTILSVRCSRTTNGEKMRVTETYIPLGDLPQLICEQMLENNNGYFQLMGVMVSYFRSKERNEVEIVFSHKVLRVETYRLIHQQEDFFKDLCSECIKVKSALSMGAL